MRWIVASQNDVTPVLFIEFVSGFSKMPCSLPETGDRLHHRCRDQVRNIQNVVSVRAEPVDNLLVDAFVRDDLHPETVRVPVTVGLPIRTLRTESSVHPHLQQDLDGLTVSHALRHEDAKSWPAP